MSNENLLALEEQLCFPVYATSRLIIRLYQPLLDEIGLTYTQYLVMLVLWENDEIKITDICSKLFLNTNTITPLINKLVEKKLVEKQKQRTDVRSSIVKLTDAGHSLKNKAECIPASLAESSSIPNEELVAMKNTMWKFLNQITDAIE